MIESYLMGIRRILYSLLAACVLVGAIYTGNRFRAWKHRSLLEDADKLRLKGKWPEMEKILRSALRFGGSDDAWRSLAQALIRQGRIEESLDAARKCVRRGPGNAWNRVQLAEAALLSGDVELALRTVKEGLDSAADQGPQQTALEDLRRRSSPHVFELAWSFDKGEVPLKNGRAVVGLPTMATPFQTAEVSFRGAALRERFLLEGNWAARLDLGTAARFELRAKIRVRPGSLRPMMSSAPAGPSPRMEKYLGKTVHLDPQAPLARQVGEGCRKASPRESVECLNRWFRDHLRWDINSNAVSSEAVLHQGYGNCVDLAKAFTAISRAAGVPAREVRGIWVMLPDGKLSGHSWVEVHIPGPGWVPIEPGDMSSFGRIDANKVRLFHYGFQGDEALLLLGGDNVAEQRVRFIGGRLLEDSAISTLFGRIKGMLSPSTKAP